MSGPSGKPERSKWAAFSVCVFLVLAVLAVFGQTAGFGFVNLDDDIYVYANPVVTGGLVCKNLALVWIHAECNFYHPLTMMSLMADYQIHQLQPGGYHLANVLIHAASAVALFLVLRRMTGAFWRSAFVAAVFAVHPLRAESVAWVAERKDVLATFFFMLTLGAWLHYVRKTGSSGRYLAVAGVFALGLLCKPTAVTMPFLLLVLDYWPLGRFAAPAPQPLLCGIPRKLILEKIPLLALAAAASVAAYFAQGRDVAPMAEIPMSLRLGNALISCVVYLREMVWPTGLAGYYPLPQSTPPLPAIAGALLLLACISWAALAARRKTPWLLAGWLWYLGMLVPMIGLVAVSRTAHADRCAYLPGIGLLIALTWGAADWCPRFPYRRPILGGLMAAAIGAAAVCGHSQTSYWRDSEALWRRALAVTSDNSVAHCGLGATLAARGALDEAIAQDNQALEINPAYALAHNNLGAALLQKGNLDGAVTHHRQAVQLSPDSAEFHHNFGLALSKNGHNEEALAQFRAAVNLQPDYVQARKDLGLALFANGNVDEAVAQYQAALNLNPDDADTRESLAYAQLSKGNLDASIANYERVTKTNPRSAGAYANLGNAFFQKGQARAAMNAWQKSLEIEPAALDVLNNLAWLMATSPDDSIRDGPKALALARQAEKLTQARNPTVLHTLAAAEAESGNFTAARTTARQALQLATEQNNEALKSRLQKEIPLYNADTPLSAPRRPGPSRSKPAN